MFEMTQGDLVALAQATALKYGLDPAVVCAIAEQESGDRKPDPSTGKELWNTWAIRNEPGFDAKYIQPLHKSSTEEVCRSCSWGLMQLMGESARELGYAGDLTRLLIPEIGLDLGCKWFRVKLLKAQGNVNKGLLLWNGGGDVTYDQAVLARVAKYRAQAAPKPVLAGQS